jgi:hypothetical protein
MRVGASRLGILTTRSCACAAFVTLIVLIPGAVMLEDWLTYHNVAGGGRSHANHGYQS